MRIGFYQFAPTFGDKETNLRRIEAKIVNLDFDLLVLPELCTTGYAFKSQDEIKPLAEPIQGPTTDRVKNLAGDRVIVLGLPESKNSQLYNSAVAVGPFEPVVYRKIHLFRKEKEVFTPGDTGFTVFNLQDIKIGLMICFDWIFPEAARSLTLKGAEIICHPSNLILPYCQDAMVTRSIENRVFTITANRIGKEEMDGLSYAFTGKSQITDPEGKVLSRAEGDEIVTIIDIDPYQARNKSATPENDLLKDRKREFYIL